jgi:hypothetical protein
MLTGVEQQIIAVETVVSRPAATQGVFAVTWRIVNVTDGALAITEAWLPHGQFRAERQTYDPALELPAGGAIMLTRDVVVAAEPGETVENGFLILIVRRGEEVSRVLVRMAVHAAVDGSVQPRIDAITSHPVGFAPAQLGVTPARQESA